VDAPYSSWTGDAGAEKQLRVLFRTSPSWAGASVLRGIVVDPNGQPVSGAKILVGYRHLSNMRETTAEAEGTFVVNGCKLARPP